MQKNPVRAFVASLMQKRLTVAFAESMTCGMAAEKLATIRGTSGVLTGGVVCYTPEVKHQLLNVSKALMEKYTCESMQVTEALVKGLKKIMMADIHAAITGLASEGGSETPGKPVGTVFICFSYENKIYKLKKRFYGRPGEIRRKASYALYAFILDTIA